MPSKVCTDHCARSSRPAAVSRPTRRRSNSSSWQSAMPGCIGADQLNGPPPWGNLPFCSATVLSRQRADGSKQMRCGSSYTKFRTLPHPQAHIIVPGGGVSPDRERWIACRLGFFLPVPVLSRLFRRLFLEGLNAAYQAGRLQFFADQAALAQPAAFQTFLAALRKVEWVVYAKRPFGGPDAVLAYLSRYTHRTAIANSRLVAFAGERVTFKWKDYRAKGDARYKLMTLDANEFIRRFLIHVLPDGFHRIRHYGLFANANRANNIALARRLLAVPDPTPSSRASDHAENGRDDEDCNACPCCGGRMIIVEAFEPGCQPCFWPVPSIGLDSS